MKETDRQRLLTLAQKIEKVTINDIVGATLVENGVTEDKFFKTIRDCELGMTVFGCNVGNAVTNQKYDNSKKPTLNEMIEIVNEITKLINQ